MCLAWCRITIVSEEKKNKYLYNSCLWSNEPKYVLYGVE